VGMIRSDAPLRDVADHLGHTDIKITRIYAKELTIAENKYGKALVKRFGIKRKANR
jgi:integrase